MNRSLLIYADVCCLNRPLDDLQQARIRLEAEAMLTILQKCEDGEWTFVNSDAIHFEILKNTNPDKREQLQAILSLATVKINSTHSIEAQTQHFMKLGLKLYDALHLASAHAASVDVFLTTDDRLLKTAKRNSESIFILVENPVTWLMQQLQQEN